MSFYENRILPWVIDFSCSQPPIMALREKVVPLASGKVLEVGIGSAVNLALYDSQRVDLVYGLEPSEGMRKKAQKNLAASDIKVKWLGLPGEKIPLEDKSVDTVLLTYTLCTIPGWLDALHEMYRVMKDDGSLLFCEHGLSPDKRVSKWQHRITPAWKHICGGCHLNRPVIECIESAQFRIEWSESCYMEKTPRFVGYMTYGLAKKQQAGKSSQECL